MSKRSGLMTAAIIAMMVSMKNHVSWDDLSTMEKDKKPTLKDQFTKRKPQGYKKHLRKKH